MSTQPDLAFVHLQGLPDTEVTQRLADLVTAIREQALSKSTQQPEPPSDLMEARIIASTKSLYRRRRARAKFFPELTNMFGEAGWDVLLDLFIADLEGRRVSVSSACIAADVPPTTALRWIDALEDRATILREPDPADRRRTYLTLSPDARMAMLRYITDVVIGRTG